MPVGLNPKQNNRVAGACGCRLLLLGFAFSFAVLPAQSQDQPASNFFQLFTQAPTYIKLGKSGIPSRFFLYVEPSPRIGRENFRINQMLLRQGLAYQPTSWCQARVTYDSAFNFQDNGDDTPINYFYEQRIGSQLFFKRKFGRLTTTYRTRLEQRWFQIAEGVSNRFRHQLSFGYPISEKYGVSALFYDELFLNLNSIENGPQRGVDANRIFAGISKRIKNDINLQLGYRLQYVNRSDTDDEGQHQLWVNLTSAF